MRSRFGLRRSAVAAALSATLIAACPAVALTHVMQGEPSRGFPGLDPAASADSGTRGELASIAALVSQREYEKALAAIAALEKKAPGTALPHHLRGGVLLAKGDAAGARRSFESASKIDPKFFPAVAMLAQLDLAEKKPDRARQRFEAVLARDATHMQALLALAGLRAASGSAPGGKPVAGGAPPVSQEVVTLIDKAMSAHPTETAPRLALIQYYATVNDAPKAVAAARAAMAAMGDRPEILDAAARAYHAAGESSQAITTYQKLASLQPSSPQPHVRIAELHLAAKDSDAARESLRKALSIRPDAVEAQRGMIALELQAGRLQEAIDVARQMQKQRPKEPIGYAFEGDIHAAQKNWGAAATAYRGGLKQASSTDLAARLYLALSGSNAAEAERFASTWLQERPKDTAFRLHVAQSANARKDYATAAQHYRKLLESESNNPIILNNLAWAEFQLKDPKAVEHAEQANTLAPNQPAIMDTLGVLLVEKGDTARGLPLLQKASAMAPQAPSIRLNLAKALIKVGQKDAARKELDELAKLGDKFPDQAEVAKLKQRL